MLALGLACVTLAAAAAEPRPLGRDDVQWLERITYGIDSASVALYRGVGRERFLSEQLSGRDDRLPPAVQARIAALEISRITPERLLADEQAEQQRLKNASESDKQAARKARNENGNDLLNETVERHLLRAIYSPAQLKEQMDWFWLNHFSVFAHKAAVRWLAADYEERAIRPHALGKFRDLVLAALKHPAMLQYLDNAQNAAGHVNENYARELMELHTLGVDAGYTQRDVQELARVLTGLSVARADAPKRAPGYVSDGAFAFYPARHDFGDKVLLGQTIHGRGFAEIEEAVELLTKQPACARFVSRKLAQYFVADAPPASLVEAMAHTFQRSDGDIAATLRTLFESKEFAASLGGKFKDPQHFVVSSVRLACDGGTVGDLKPLLGWLNGQNEALFGHASPDGYALTEAAWSGSGQLTRRFEIARAIGANFANVLACVPNPSGDVQKLDTALVRDQVTPYLSAQTLGALARAASPREWNALLLASPDWNFH